MNKNKSCPECGSKNIVKIIYGIPTEEMIEAANEGVIEIGGSDPSDTNPKFKCKDCKSCFGGMEIGYIKYNELRSINITIDTGQTESGFVVLIDFDDRRICWYKGDSKLNRRIKYLDYDGFKKLINLLKRVHFLEWAQLYHNHHRKSKETNSWDITVITKYGFCNKKGYQAYPKEWNALFNALYTITKDKDFSLYLQDESK